MSLPLTGFVRPRLSEIKADYDQKFTQALGPVNTNADAVVGQIIGIFSAAMDDIWEAIQNTYDAMYPFSAEGLSLDGAVSYVGLLRIGSSPTKVTAICYGLEGTYIPVGSRARSTANRQFLADESIVISRSIAGDVSIKVLTVVNTTLYSIILDGVLYSYTSDASATIAEILDGLKADIDSSLYIATISNETLSIQAIDKHSSFTISIDSNLHLVELGSPCNFTAIDNGAFALPIGTLTTMDTSIVGWDSLDNLIVGATGTNVETDEELRRRHAEQGGINGTATVLAIKSKLENTVVGVTSAYVYENRTNLTIDGMPPHSIEAVVTGGLDQAVADRLFEVKAAGIETYGTISMDVVDPNGDVQICYFSRPVDAFIWVKVTIVGLYTEEILSPDVSDAIKNAVVEYTQVQPIGEDIIPQRYYGPIFSATNGIAQILVEVAKTETAEGSPSYETSSLSLTRIQVANIIADRVIIIGA